MDCSNVTGATSDLCTLVDTDTNTQLNESQVDAYVSNNGYLTSYNESDPLFVAWGYNYDNLSGAPVNVSELFNDAVELIINREL